MITARRPRCGPDPVKPNGAGLRSSPVFVAPTMNAGAPAPTPEEVAALIAQHYGLMCSVRQLTGERDSNFKVQDGHRDTYVFKLAHPEEPEGVTQLQIDTLLWLERVPPPDLTVPRIRPTLQGGSCIVIVAPDGCRRIGRLVNFVPGSILGDVRPTADQRASCGAALARLAKALAGFEHRNGRHHLIWDLRHAPAIRPLLPLLSVTHERAVASRFLDRFESELGTRFDALPQQVVHNDFNRRNVVVSAENPDRVTGAIDFGDVVRTARVADVAIGAASQIVSEADAAENAADFIRAYHRENPLTALEVEVLPILIAVRLVMASVIPLWHRANNPENPHYQHIGSTHARSRLRAAEMILTSEGARALSNATS